VIRIRASSSSSSQQQQQQQQEEEEIIRSINQSPAPVWKYTYM